MFTWKDLIARNNNELLANLGNFVNRVIKFVIAKYSSTVPDYNYVNGSDESIEALKKDVNEILKQYNEALEGVHLREGLRVAMTLSSRGNLFLQDNKLDNNLFNNHSQKCANVIGAALNLVYLVSAIISPYMPGTTQNMCHQLNVEERSIPDLDELDNILPGHTIGKAAYLFR